MNIGSEYVDRQLNKLKIKNNSVFECLHIHAYKIRILGGTERLFIYLFIKTYLYRVVHNQTILILFCSVALFLAKSKSRDN